MQNYLKHKLLDFSSSLDLFCDVTGNGTCVTFWKLKQFSMFLILTNGRCYDCVFQPNDTRIGRKSCKGSKTWNEETRGTKKKWKSCEIWWQPKLKSDDSTEKRIYNCQTLSLRLSKTEHNLKNKLTTLLWWWNLSQEIMIQSGLGSLFFYRLWTLVLASASSFS